MQNALSVLMKALAANPLFRNSNEDVKVAGSFRITELTRITATGAPCDDKQMKEVLKLIVSSLKYLFDKSSRSYIKRTSSLEILARVRLCSVMLDLDCDAVIIEMFHNFYKAVRDYHPENVFSYMEMIMIHVLIESENISMELLFPILLVIEDKGIPKEAGSTKQVNLANDKCPKLEERADKPKNVDTIVVEPDDLGTEKVVNFECHDKSKDLPGSSLEHLSIDGTASLQNKKETEPSENLYVYEKEVETMSDHKKDSRDAPGSLHEDLGSVADAQPQREDSMIKEIIPVVDDALRKASEGTSDAEAKQNKCLWGKGDCCDFKGGYNSGRSS
ncbi:hypothetical protein QQP08_010945 [Theobroma cacao]|nr:hypothetical protein QQP08_010945 [Theobroma cacao]